MSSRNPYIALTPEHTNFKHSNFIVGISNPTSILSQTLAGSVEQTSADEDESEEEGDNREKFPRLRVFVNEVNNVIQRNAGLLLIVGSQACFSFMDTSVKVLHGIDPPITTLQLVIVRMGITYILCMMYMITAKIPDPILGPKGVRLLLISRGIGGFLGLFGMYYSLQYLSLSDATVLTFLSPMCTALAASVLLGETFTLREASAGIISLAGVILIARPAFIFGKHTSSVPAGQVNATPIERLVAVGVSLIGVLGATVAYTSLRAIGKRAHPLHATVYLAMQSTVIAGVFMIYQKTPIIIPAKIGWLALLLMIGVTGFTGQTLLTMGLQREAAGRGTLAIYTLIVFATMSERIFFHTLPSYLSIIGTIMIVGSALYVALTKENSVERTSKSAVVLLGPSDHQALEQGLSSTYCLGDNNSTSAGRVPSH